MERAEGGGAEESVPPGFALGSSESRVAPKTSLACARATKLPWAAGETIGLRSWRRACLSMRDGISLCLAHPTKAKIPCVRVVYVATRRKGLPASPGFGPNTQRNVAKNLHHCVDEADQDVEIRIHYSDINGNDYVDWEEFTSFCIELGIISEKVCPPHLWEK